MRISVRPDVCQEIGGEGHGNFFDAHRRCIPRYDQRFQRVSAPAWRPTGRRVEGRRSLRQLHARCVALLQRPHAPRAAPGADAESAAIAPGGADRRCARCPRPSFAPATPPRRAYGAGSTTARIGLACTYDVGILRPCRVCVSSGIRRRRHRTAQARRLLRGGAVRVRRRERSPHRRFGPLRRGP